MDVLLVLLQLADHHTVLHFGLVHESRTVKMLLFIDLHLLLLVFLMNR